MYFSSVCRSYRDGTGKGRSFYEANRPVVPAIVLFGLFIVWVHLSPAHIMRQQPRLLLFTCGTLFANIAVSISANLYLRFAS